MSQYYINTASPLEICDASGNLLVRGTFGRVDYVQGATKIHLKQTEIVVATKPPVKGNLMYIVADDLNGPQIIRGRFVYERSIGGASSNSAAHDIARELNKAANSAGVPDTISLEEVFKS